ncbi:hypothetical protein T4E_275 [Trichinella pseudospiralis]|uniref:Uncharacterized protein n=1 Tax=Trichinella pseudospiralis TaxID=6337 RepID=A0A0V0YL01_TRIPS|nr:hypothetical protein T4E_275 [Trichinella pseudospiralis]
MQQQKEFSATHQLMLMRHIYDVAAPKKLFSLKQKLIVDDMEYVTKMSTIPSRNEDSSYKRFNCVHTFKKLKMSDFPNDP